MQMAMQKNNYIQIKDSQIIYGLAIMLMIFHHMFGFPDRIHTDYVSLLYYHNVPVATIIAGAGRICIAIYAFISGYGLMNKFGKNIHTGRDIVQGYKIIGKQLYKFYSRYCMVLIVFLIIGIAFFDMHFSGIKFIKNVIGISCSYNAEWWYVWQYVRMLLLFPFIACGVNRICSNKNKWIIGIVVLVLFCIFVKIGVIAGFWIVLAEFIIGVVLSKFDYKQSEIKSKFLRYIISVIGILFVVVARLTFWGSGTFDFILVGILVYSVLNILKSKFIPDVINNGLRFLGKYSIYIWLIHTFFIYYFFQNLIFKFKFSILIYIITVVIVLIVSMVLEKMYQLIHTLIIKCKEHIYNKK